MKVYPGAGTWVSRKRILIKDGDGCRSNGNHLPFTSLQISFTKWIDTKNLKNVKMTAQNIIASQTEKNKQLRVATTDFVHLLGVTFDLYLVLLSTFLGWGHICEPFVTETERYANHELSQWDIVKFTGILVTNSYLLFVFFKFLLEISCCLD